MSGQKHNLVTRLFITMDNAQPTLVLFIIMELVLFITMDTAQPSLVLFITMDSAQPSSACRQRETATATATAAQNIIGE